MGDQITGSNANINPRDRSEIPTKGGNRLSAAITLEKGL